jgi:hypothetical protein
LLRIAALIIIHLKSSFHIQDETPRIKIPHGRLTGKPIIISFPIFIPVVINVLNWFRIANGRRKIRSRLEVASPMTTVATKGGLNVVTGTTKKRRRFDQ